MANVGTLGILRHMDDPSVTVIGDGGGAAGITWNSDAGGSATNFVKAVAAGKGLHYIGVMDAADNSLLEFAGNNLQFFAQEGHSEIETLIAFEDASELSFNFGFNDTVEDGNLPVDFSGTTFTPTATAWVGFVFDGTDATNKDLHVYWVNAGSSDQTDSTGSVDGQEVRFRGIAPTDAKWMHLKVDLDDRGSGLGARATFTATTHTGISASKVFNTNISRSTGLCWHLGIETRTSTGGDVFLRNTNWAQTIPTI